MDTKTMIRGVKYVAEKHKNDTKFTGQTVITDMCNDIIPKLEKLSAYETAEEEGRLVILPKCNIGDTVYLPIDFQNKIYTGEIEGFEYAKMRNTWVAKIRTDDGETCYEAFEDFGKTVFFSREEAEKALDEMEKSD